MRIEIDRTGQNDPPWPRITVDGRACLVDISGLPGPFESPDVVKIEWDDTIPEIFPAGRDQQGRATQAEPAGKIWRRPPGTAMMVHAPFTDRQALQPYLEAFGERFAALAGA